MQGQETYRALCEERKDLPLFMQAYWLDLTYGRDQWDAVFSRRKDGSIRGAWAYGVSMSRGMRHIRLPLLTPCTALWMDPVVDRPLQKQISYTQAVLADLEKQIPQVQVFEVKLHWSITDWLPFYWRGYHAETRYTFRFPSVDTEQILENTSKSFRRNLRAAQRDYTVQKGNVHDLYGMMENVFEMRNARVYFPESALHNIINVLQERNQCHLYAAHDSDAVKATVLAVWDEKTTYYLIGGRAETDGRNGMNLLLWEALTDAGRRGHAFDFEGSMIEGVNRFFQNFGGPMIPYHYLYKYRGLAKLKYLR